MVSARFERIEQDYRKNTRFIQYMSIRALQPPSWTKEWHCGVRVSKSGRLVGFISAIPATLRVYNQ